MFNLYKICLEKMEKAKNLLLRYLGEMLPQAMCE